jgi:predicted TIM-barrel fold metal-dependent hydrolase
MTRTFHGNNPRTTAELLAWHGASLPEEVLEPALPVVDTHHHLYGQAGEPRYYRMQDLTEDLSGGHAVIGTVYIEAYQSGWRSEGPQALRPVGEVDMIIEATRTVTPLHHGPCKIAAGIVAHADLCLGDAVAEVIEAHSAAAQGRLRGIRFQTAWDGGSVGATLAHMPARDVMAQAAFRRGVACVQAAGLSLDTWVYHHQLRDLLDLVDAFPDLLVVIDHLGGLIGVGEHRRQRTSAFMDWVRDLRALAQRPQVRMKVGGLGMPVFGFGFEHASRPATSMELACAWQPYVDACIEIFGTQRLLLETNFPVDRQSASYSAIWNAYKRTTRHLSTDERRDLFYRTACTTYRLPDLQNMGDALWPIATT